jgi:hypothetical protein
MRSLAFCFFCIGVFLLSGGEQRFWDKQDSSSWTPQQVAQFTTASPWAKQVTAVLTSNDSNMATGAPRGGGGGRGGRGGTRGTSGTPPTAEMPKWEAIVRWASAKPMQQVLKLHLPDNFQGRYVVSVSGLPVAGDTTEIAERTTLQLKRGDAVHPESVYQDPSDTSSIYFSFLPSMIDITNGRTAVFNMVASPYEIKAKFNVGEMKYLGEPAL